MRKKALFILPFLTTSIIGLTGCGILNSVTAPLDKFMNPSKEDTVTANDVDVGTEDAPESDIFGDTIEEETSPEESENETSFEYDAESTGYSDIFEDYYTATSTTGDEAVSETEAESESDSEPMYSAEYYFKQISDMDLPEGAVADKDGNIHYKGYRLLKCNRDMLPSTAVVGAPINYEIYVTTLPDGEKSNNANTSADTDADDEDGVIEDTTDKRRIETAEESINRVQNAVEAASKIKNNAEAGSYDAINKEATENMGKISQDTDVQETTPFVPTTPDEDPEYEGKLVSIDKKDITGPQIQNVND